MPELLTKQLRWFMNAAPGYWSAHEKTDNKIIYLNPRMVHISGFKNLADAEGRGVEEVHAPVAKYATIFKQQNKEVITARHPKEYFDTHHYTDNWYCFHGIKKPFIQANANQEAPHKPRDADDAIAGVIYHGTDITTPATIELAHYLAACDGKASAQVSYEIGATSGPYRLSEAQQRLLFWQLRDTPSQALAQRLGYNRYQLAAQQEQLWQYLGVSNHLDCMSKAIALGYRQMLPKSLFLAYGDAL